MSKKVNNPPILKGDIQLAEIRRDLQKQYGDKYEARRIAGSIGETGLRGQNYDAMGFGKASRGYKSWLPFTEERKPWGGHYYQTPEQMESLAYEQQNFSEILGDTIVGFTKGVGAGFLGSIGSWDIANMTNMALDKTNANYTNWFNETAASINENISKENRIYQDPSGSIWNGAFLAQSVQQLGYTGGIIAEMLAEQALLGLLTGGAGNAGTVGSTTIRATKLLSQFGSGLLSGIREAHMNALETQHNMYEKLKNVRDNEGNLKYIEEEAFNLATKAGNLHFKTEAGILAAVNALQNILFFGRALKGLDRADVAFNKASSGMTFGVSDMFQSVGEKLASGLSDKAQKRIGWGLMMGSEGIEEMVQTGIGIYSENKVLGLESNFKDIVTNEDVLMSGVHGALGGGFFGYGMSKIEAWQNKSFNERYKAFFDESIDRTRAYTQKEKEAHQAYAKAVQDLDADPTNKDLKIKAQQAEINFLRVRNASTMGEVRESLIFDHAKGEGTIAYNMQIEKMKQIEEAAKNRDIDSLKDFGIIDENGKEIYDGAIKFLVENTASQIAKAEAYKNSFANALENKTDDVSIAMAIADEEVYMQELEAARDRHNKDFNKLLSGDTLFNKLSSDAQRRFKLEAEKDSYRNHENLTSEMQKRLEEIEEELNNLPSYHSEDLNYVNSINREAFINGYTTQTAYNQAIKDSAQEIGKLNDPKHIAEIKKKQQEEAIKQAKSIAEAKKAEKKAEESGDKDLIDKAKSKVKDLKKKFQASEDAGTNLDTSVEDNNEQDINDPTPDYQSKKRDSNIEKNFMSMFTSGSQNIDNENIEVEQSEEHFARPNIDASEESNNKFNNTIESLRKRVSKQLGREATYEDFISTLLDEVEEDFVKENLESVKRAFEANGHKTSDVSHLFGSTDNIFKKSINTIAQEDSITEEKDIEKNISTTDKLLEVDEEQVERLEQQGIGVGINKLATYNSRINGKYTSRENDVLGHPTDNTLRYTAQIGDKLILSEVEDPMNTHITVYDRRNPNNIVKLTTMTFGEFLEWVTSGNGEKYGYPRIEKGSPEYNELYQDKVPMVYRQYNEKTGEVGEIVAFMHDVEWYNLDTVSKHAENPYELIQEGRNAVKEERKAFFEKGQRIAEVKNIDILGSEMFLSEKNSETGKMESNMIDGTTFVTLEEGTGDTRIGLIEEGVKVDPLTKTEVKGNFKTVKLQDGTVINPSEVIPGTNIPRYIGAEILESLRIGSAVEARFIKYINGEPIYKIYVVKTQVANVTKPGFEQISDTTFNTIKGLYLAKIWEMSSSEVRKMLTEKFGIDQTKVNEISRQFANGNIKDVYLEDLLKPFIRTVDKIDTKIKTHFQPVAKKDYLSVFNPKENRIHYINFTQNGQHAVSSLEEVENFISVLFEGENPVMKNVMGNIDKKSLTSNKEMKVIDDKGNVIKFEGKHGESTYAGYIKSTVKTNVQSFQSEQIDPRTGRNIWITDISPKVQVSSQGVTQLNGKIGEKGNSSRKTSIQKRRDGRKSILKKTSNNIPSLERPESEKQISQELRDKYGLREEDFNEAGFRNLEGLTMQEFVGVELVREMEGDNMADIIKSQYIQMAKSEFPNGDFGARPNIDSISSDEISTNNIEGVTDKELNEVGFFLFHSVLSTIELSEGNSVKPRLIWNRLNASLDKFLKPEIDALRARVEAFEKAGLKDLADLKRKELNKLEAIYNNKESIIKELNTQLNNLLKIEIQEDAKVMGLVDEDGNTIEDPFSNDYEYEEHLEADFSKMSTEKDLKLSYSTALKIVFAGIKAKNKANQPVVTSLGLNSFESIDIVSEVLKTILLNTKPNIEAMLNQLELVASETAGSNYTLSNIVSNLHSKLKNSPEHVKNEIIYKLTQRKLSMEKVIYSKDSKGNSTLKVQNTNSNSEDNKLRENWKNAFLLSEFVTFNKEGVRILDREYIKSFLERLKTIKKEYTGSKEYKKQVLQLYRDMGVNISNNTFEQLVTVDFGKNSFLGVVENSLEDLLKKEGDLVLEDDKNFFLDNNANSYMKDLRLRELLLNSMFSSGTQREGGKNFPNSTYKIMLDDVIDELYDTNSEKFKALQEFAYSSENMYLDLIKNTNIRSVIKEFYTRVSPESIKEQGRKVFGDNSIDKTSEADNILTQLGFFQHTLKEVVDVTGSKYANYTGVSFRLGKMFTPTLSDKGQMIALTSVLADLKDNNFVFNEDGTIDITNEVYDLMLDHVFYPELRRIADAYNRKINIKNYKEASKFFNMIPAFNNIDRNGIPLWSILEEVGKSENRKEAFENILNNEEIKNQAREVLRKVVQSELTKKIEVDEKGNLKDGSWVKAGFVTSEVNKSTGTATTSLEHMDTKYVNSKSKRVLNGLQKGRVVALDFIVNQFLSSSNFYQLYIGDLALYAPGAKKYLTKEGNLDAFNLSKITGDAVTKRVAALIAPGNVLANSSYATGVSKTYRQIFINDVVTSSSIFREYVSMMNNGKVPKENEEWLKKLNSEDSKERAEARKKLAELNPDLAGYLEMDSTDAQEYTTWQEHLDILLGQGRITLEDKERVSKAIKEDNLSKEDLKIIMNPLKPVYAGTIVDKENGLNRFVYIKSSSFPLLPQLTKNLKLDKIRVAMENMQEKTGQNVRMSYQTANKVGAIDTTLSTEDIYNAEDVDKLFEEKLLPNSLELNRNSFKIQQDTPYKAKKYMEKGSDTYSPMGSQIWKMLMGSGVNKMGAIFPNVFPQEVLDQLGIVPNEDGLITGEDLDKIKFNAEKDYFELQEQSLMEELGLDKDKSYFDLTTEEKQKVFKNLIDMLVRQVESGAYDKNILKELEIDETGLKTKTPLWATASADKFEAIFLSVIKNRFISLKLPGNSHIVGSSEGFEKVETLENLDKETKSGIIWLDPNHSGDLKASYITKENGKKVLKESQVLIQSHFLTHQLNPETGKMEAKKIDLREYTKVENGVLVLDEEKLKIHPEILQNFSFRIPSSAHQSGAILRVVGFLPENSGDLMIVPDEHTKQIGEDFDIDKRYVYKSNYRFNPTEGTINKITMSDVAELEALVEDLSLADKYTDTNELVGSLFNTNLNNYLGEIQAELENLTGKSLEEIINNKKLLKKKIKSILKKKALENTMIDTYKSVFTSPSEEMQQKIFRVLSMDVAENTANLIDSASNSIDKENYTFLSDEVQRSQLKSGSTGKLGTAMYSNSVASQALMEKLSEENKLRIYEEDSNGEWVPKKITIGAIEVDGKTVPYTSDGTLGNISTIDGLRDIAAVHSENQNSAVDNVKALIMSKRNENNYTMPVLIQMTYRGFDQVDLFTVELVDGSYIAFKSEGDMQDYVASNQDKVKSTNTKVHMPSLFLAQPILKRYVELMEKSKSITAAFNKDLEASVLGQLYEEFPLPANVELIDGRNLTGYNLFDNIQGNVDHNLQRKVLEIFLSLKNEANDFSKIQNLIALNSGGLGKSYFDVLQRLELLDEIASSSIENAHKLIGDFISIDNPLFESNEEKFINEGYVKLGNNAWKPTTSEGLMLINSLKNSIKVMEINYPYNNSFVRNIMNTIIANKGKKLTLHNSTEFKWEVMNALKDATNSLESIGLFEGDIDAERKRLFFGETKTVEVVREDYTVEVIGDTYVKGVIVNGQASYEGRGTLILVKDSEGRIVKKLPRKESIETLFKKGQFRSKFLDGTIKPNDKGGYDFIEKKSIKIKESLGDFLHKIKNQRSKNGNLLFPLLEDNKFLKDLSIRMNAKEKNNITIIQNNNSKTIDFNIISKNDAFIQLLQDDKTNLGEWNGEIMTPRKLAQDLASYAFLANQEGGAIGFRSFIDVQYLELLGYSDNIRNAYNSLSKDEMLQEIFIRQFYQHNPEYAFMIDKVEAGVREIYLSEDITTSDYVATRDYTIDYSTKQYRLFKRVPDTNKFIELPVLGTFGYNEYNLNNPLQTSQLSNRNILPPKHSEMSGNKVEEKTPTSISEIFDTSSVENLVDSVINKTSNAKVKAVLESLKPYLNTETKVSVEEVQTSTGRLLEGAYNPNTNTIRLSSTIISRALAAGKTMPEIIKFMEEVITEELLHSVQVQELSKYGTVTNSYEFIPNADAPLFVTKLVALYEQAREALPYNAQTGENYESKNIFEFMAGVFEHREEYREKLDSITDRKGKSLLQKVIDHFGKIFEYIVDKKYSEASKEVVIEMLNASRNRNTNTTISYSGDGSIFEKTSNRPNIENLIESSKVNRFLKEDILFRDISNITNDSSLSVDNLISLLEKEGLITKECK